MKRATILILLSCMALSCVKADKTISITVRAGEYDRTDCVVSADIFKLDMGESMDVVLYEQTGKGKKRVASQVVAEKGKTPLLYWILDGETKAGTTRTYHAGLTPRQAPGATPMDIEDTQKALILKKEGKQILQYNYTHVDPPDGVDKAYGRSGFIHPAYSPAGNILTTIQPKDHYHHYGIWNTWTHVVYDEVLYDLWNIGGKQGTVRAKAIEETSKGAVLAGYTASLDHYIFTPSEEKVIINELWKIKAWNIPAGGFLWDFESLLHPSAPLPVLLQQYRYAGFGYRATEEWTKENCEMMTSEGKTRQEIDGSTARWIYITGDTGTGRSGLLFLGHPDNYNAPEPLRIWNEEANGGRGDAFINIAPTKNKDWLLEPGNTYRLRYRILSYEGEMTPGQADRLWNDFAYPPTTDIK